MITEDFVSFETAKLLKEKGFDSGDCKNSPHYAYSADGQFSGPSWDTKYPAPTLQMAMKWLREEKGVAVIPIISGVLDDEKFLWDIEIVVAKTHDSYSQGWVYEKQEAACEAAIKYCIENLI